MNRDKILLLFIQGPTTDVYINVLTHCVNNESVKEVFFVINGGSSTALSEAKDQIRLIRNRFEELLREPLADFPDRLELCRFQPDYRKAYESVPTLLLTESKIIKVSFSKPESSVGEIKKRFLHSRNLLVDITGCSKKVSTDVISSYLPNGIEHIRYFELDPKVYKERWKKIYHVVRSDLPYYDYIDFSEPGTTTISSFNRMRLQGQLIRVLFVAVALLGIFVVILIEKRQNALAQYASMLLAVVTGLGLLNDSVGAFRFVKRK